MTKNEAIKEVARILALRFLILESTYEETKSKLERDQIRETVAAEILNKISWQEF